jgi:hypothetical protein
MSCAFPYCVCTVDRYPFDPLARDRHLQTAPLPKTACQLWSCDLHPDCTAQGCESNPETCQRIRDLRAGIDKQPDYRPKIVVYESNPSSFMGWVRKLFMEGS